MTEETPQRDEPLQAEKSSLDSFETAVKKLEEVVDKLGDQTLPLDEAMKLFEEGIKVSRKCAQYLNDARVRVEKLIEESPGVFSLEAFDQAENADGSELKNVDDDDSSDAS